MAVEIKRRTKETDITVTLGKKTAIRTGLNFLDHMLNTLSVHSGIPIEIAAKSMDGNEHHLVEDTGICIGQAIEKMAAGKRTARFGHAIVPMDEAVATAAIDLGGRAYSNVSLEFGELAEKKLSDLGKENIEHFFQSLAQNARMNLYARAEGKNDHHKVEALFKAFALSLRMATAPRKGDTSTK